jgi:hypothetical protein
VGDQWSILQFFGQQLVINTGTTDSKFAEHEGFGDNCISGLTRSFSTCCHTLELSPNLGDGRDQAAAA